MGDPLLVSGWGLTSRRDFQSAGDTLQQIMIPVVHRDVCDPQFVNHPYPKNFTKEWEVCAGYAGMSYANVCHGDSGGPAVYHSSWKDEYKQYGVVSWGTYACPIEANYAVFTDVSSAYGWVTKTIREAKVPEHCE